MATLEKIRSKSVFLFIIIIVALLAFILGDFLTSGRSFWGHDDTVAKVGGEKIAYNEFKERVDQMNEQLRARNNGRQQDVDNDELTQKAIMDLALEKLVNAEYDRMGITVTDKELSAAMTADVPHPAVAEFITTVAQQLNLTPANGLTVLGAIQNPTAYGLDNEVAQQLKTLWAQQEKNLEISLKSQAYGRMLGGLFTANKIDAKAAYNDRNTSRDIAYVATPLSAIADDKVEVTDDDLKAKYDELKETFRLTEPVASIEYIKVDIVPSAADIAAGENLVQEVMAGLNEKEALEALNDQPAFIHQTYTLTAEQMKQQMPQLPDSALTVGAVGMLPQLGQNYVLYKVLDIDTDVDKLNFSIVPAQTKAAADSLLNLVSQGKTMDDLMAQSQETPLKGVEPASLHDALANQPVGQPFVYSDSINGQPVNALISVNSRPAPVKFYEIAMINYTIDPSVSTIDNLRQQLQTYVANNATAQAFKDNAAAANYNVVPTIVAASSPHVDNLADSRRAIKWAMNAKKDKVSPIYEDNKQTYLLALALVDKYDEYLPLTADDVNEAVKARVLRDKKGQQLVAQYTGKGKTLADYAAAMSVEIDSVSANFSSPILGTLGFGENTLQGQIAAANKGALVGPVAGNNAVVVFQVLDEQQPTRPFDINTDAPAFLERNTVLANPILLLLNGKKLDNRSLNFVADGDEPAARQQEEPQIPTKRR